MRKFATDYSYKMYIFLKKIACVRKRAFHFCFDMGPPNVRTGPDAMLPAKFVSREISPSLSLSNTVAVGFFKYPYKSPEVNSFNRDM